MPTQHSPLDLSTTKTPAGEVSHLDPAPVTRHTRTHAAPDSLSLAAPRRYDSPINNVPTFSMGGAAHAARDVSGHDRSRTPGGACACGRRARPGRQRRPQVLAGVRDAARV